MFSDKPPLTPADGYGIVIGFGALFAFGMVATTFCLKKYHGEATDSSEGFSTAHRSVKTGLIASAVVSSWTWAATLLQSSSVAYLYGISGPYWYASGATVQIVLFCIVAIELKRRAPFAHTFLEVVHARYGPLVHGVFILFCITTNVLVTSMLLTGGSAVVQSLTGMHIAAACFLLPLGTVVYTMFGGIKATFLTDYVHTVAVILIILYFTFITYATSPILGSTSKVYDLLVNASYRYPVHGNADGSYLTMRSKEGAIFFIINIIGNFGTVFLDNGYYNKAIAASPASALPGYILGGISWFSVPFLVATTMGLAAVALESDPSFPTYPARLSSNDVLAGLTLPAAAVALLNKKGAIATLIMIFMAVTSALSAQLIAVSSIITYDIYKMYFNPKASGKKLIYISHVSVVTFGVFMSILAIGLYYVHIDLGYLYLLMGVIISSAVVPGALTLLWRRQSRWAACLSPLLGLICSLTSWLVTSKISFGAINIETTGANGPMLVGNLVALGSPVIFVLLISYVLPDEIMYNFDSMKQIQRDNEEANYEVQVEEDTKQFESEQKLLKKNSRFAWITAIALTLVLILLVPWPMYATSYIFSKSFFKVWIYIGVVWMFISFIVVGIYPVIEGRNSIFSITAKVFGSLNSHKRVNIPARDRQTNHNRDSSNIEKF